MPLNFDTFLQDVLECAALESGEISVSRSEQTLRFQVTLKRPETLYRCWTLQYDYLKDLLERIPWDRRQVFNRYLHSPEGLQELAAKMQKLVNEKIDTKPPDIAKLQELLNHQKTLWDILLED